MADPDRPYAVVEDFLVHNCGKKDRALIAKEREKFVEGCEAHRLRGRASAQQLFDIIEPFADYAFNKSHAYGYGLVAYQTAYLKAHYPVEYLACLLTSVKTNLDKAAVYLAECRAMGIKVLNPDVNLSAVRLRRPRRRRRAGGRSCRAAARASSRSGCPRCATWARGSWRSIVAERDANGPFADFYDFCRPRRPQRCSNKRTIESLIKAGAFDSLGHPRQGLLAVFEQIIDATLARRREREAGASEPVRRCRWRRRPTPAFDERRADPRPRDRQEAAARVREGDARPLRERPPAARGRVGAEAPHRRARSPSWPSARTATWCSSAGVVTDLAAQVHEEGRADGRVHPGGPAGGHRGHGVPEDDGRARPHARRRRRGRACGAASTSATTSRS